MTKGFVKRSDFMVLAIMSLVSTDVLIEADEAYITSLDTTNPVMVMRERERELEKHSDEHAEIATESGLILADNVRTSLLGNSVAGVLTGSAADFSLLVGIKETVTIGLSTLTPALEQKVLIELVHYVPADVIAA